ncbi:MAG: alpha/beta fold hydrolase [Sterolibacteriaceae bacterium MAG5]|nr:alpha/beta fold hydrolase [Candidatus Nitricoxidireducens bremensis]
MPTLHANGIDIHYRIEGSGPWVTLSHALTTDLSLWDGLAAVLAKRFTVLRYDTRGHGATSAPPQPYDFEMLVADLLRLLDALGVERTHFVGLSMGGMIGQHFAVAAPTLVLVGADDPGTPPAASRAIAEAIPGARLEIIPSASHLSCLEQEAVFNRLVANFLAA